MRAALAHHASDALTVLTTSAVISTASAESLPVKNSAGIVSSKALGAPGRDVIKVELLDTLA